MATQNSGAFTDLGQSRDLFYTDPDNCKVESIPVEYNTRFSQNLTNLSSGSSTFIIPPGNGLKHVVITLGYNAANAAIAAQTGECSLPKGWIYNAIQQISWRIGGSNQFFMSGAQLLAANLRMVRTQSQAQALLDLAGSQFATAADIAAYAAAGGNGPILAYAVIPVWCPPSADGLAVPLPADTLAQQVMITVNLNPASQIWIPSTPAVAIVNQPPQSFDVGFFTVEQLCQVDRGMAISNHVDLNTHELLMPVTFHQQELQVAIPAGSNAVGGVPVTLTGFRSGQVKAIQLWLTQNRTVASGFTLAQQQTDLANQLVWEVPAAVTLQYAGTIYSQYNSGTSTIFNLLDGTKPPYVSSNALTLGAVGATTSASVSSQYVVLPFGNPTGSDFEADVLTHGKPILSGLVNLQLQAPDANPYTLHVQYVYNSTLVFSKSSCEYRF